MAHSALQNRHTQITEHGGHSIRVLDSLEKVYGLAEPRSHALGAVTMPRSGVASIQIAIKPAPGWHIGVQGGAAVEISDADDLTVSAHAVDLVPCQVTSGDRADEHYDHYGPALLPDVLRPLGVGEALPLVPYQWRSCWLTLRCGDVEPGTRQLTIDLRAGYTGTPIGSVTIPVTVLDVDLPDTPITVAQWLHVDGIAQYYGNAAYSDFGWGAIERFIASALESGSTSVLTPIHTPPLDTAIGTRRLDVGLIDVIPDDTEASGYRFHSGRFEQWLDICKRLGVRELELAHLFTQWGGLHAPAIDDPEGRPLFGWQTDSLGEDYQKFLQAYIPYVRAVLDQHWSGEVFWHLTDEPHSDEDVRRYRQLKDSVAPLLRDCLVTDALSGLDMWTDGIVEQPIIAIDHAQKFVDAGHTRPWLYYCTSQSQHVTNRFIGQPSYRNRVLGQQLFRYHSTGFLHWGFNFYHTAHARQPINPFTETAAGGAFRAGDPFLVYPGPGGTPWESIRFRVFREAIDDLRIFTALAEQKGREHVISLLDVENLTFVDYPRQPEHYLRGHAQALAELAE